MNSPAGDRDVYGELEIGGGRAMKGSCVLYQTSVVERRVVPNESKLGDSTSKPCGATDIHSQQPARSHILKENLEVDNLTSGPFLVQGTPPENAGAPCNTFPTVQLSPTASLSGGLGKIGGWKGQPDPPLRSQVRGYMGI